MKESLRILFGLGCLSSVVLLIVPTTSLADRNKNALEQYALSEIRVVSLRPGVECDAWLAEVLDPNGNLHTLKVGDYVGKREGRVISMGDNFLIVVEIGTNRDGELIEIARLISVSCSATSCTSKLVPLP